MIFIVVYVPNYFSTGNQKEFKNSLFFSQGIACMESGCSIVEQVLETCL